MAGFRRGRQLVLIPLVIALGATTLTGCKKTTHATKPLANISQASTAAASTSATTAAPASVSASASASASASSSATTAAPASASVSQPTTTAPAITPSAKAGAGCALIPVGSVAKALGVASIPATTEAATTLRAPIIAHQGCRYVAGPVGAGWDVNTYSPGTAPTPAQVAAEISQIPGAKQITVDGLLAYIVSEALPNGVQEQVGMYKGDQVVGIISHGKTGASVAIAQLIAAAI